MSLLLHISDSHFGAEEAAVVNALRDLAHELAPDALVFSGDVTQRARPSQFAAARQFCDSLGIAKVLVLPGNHDIPLYNLFARVVTPWGNYRKAIGRELEPVIELPDA